MKTNFICIAAAILLFVASSCKKEKKESAKLTEDQISTLVDCASTISTEVQSFMFSSLQVAADSGYNTGSAPDLPDVAFSNENPVRLKSTSALNTQSGWTGPDARGWYTMYYDVYGYKYTEKLRYRDTIDYIISYGYSGGEGSYSSVTTTKFIKYEKNNKTLYKGFSEWEVKASGYNEISDVRWRIEFTDWNPETNAGNYDWFWGVSENNGGNTVPYHRYLNVIATEKNDDLLHVKVTWWDDNSAKVGEFEYDTYCVPVYVPPIPENPED